MRTCRTLNLLFVALTCIVLWAAALWILPASRVVRANPGSLFVTVAGTGTTCSQSQPCGLQTALGKAVSRDVMYVAAGVYTGTGAAVITVTHSITLYGGWDGAPTGEVVRHPRTQRSIVDGQGARRGMYVNGTFTYTVDGFTIRHGNASNGPDACHGGGIYSYLARPIIVNNIITANVGCDLGSVWGHGGGVYVGYASAGALITGNQVIANIASTSYEGAGGGLYLLSSPLAHVVNNVVLNNTASITDAGYGGGLALISSGTCLVAGNQFENNLGGPSPPGYAGWGGAVYCDQSPSLQFRDNVVRNNVAAASGDGHGGGICVLSSPDLTLTGNLVQGNRASNDPLPQGDGGGIRVLGCLDANVSANQVLSNTAESGGGLLIGYQSQFSMTNNIVAGNRAGYAGGGLVGLGSAQEPVTGTLLHNTFVANNSGSGDGRVGVFLAGAAVRLTLTNNLFSGHSYAVYAMAGNTLTLNSTLYYANSSGDIGGPGTVIEWGYVTGLDPLLDATYHLLAGSPAIDAGVNAGVTIDIDGDPRPAGPGYDIGADEWAGAWWLYLPVVLKAG